MNFRCLTPAIFCAGRSCLRTSLSLTLPGGSPPFPLRFLSLQHSIFQSIILLEFVHVNGGPFPTGIYHYRHN